MWVTVTLGLKLLRIPITLTTKRLHQYETQYGSFRQLVSLGLPVQGAALYLSRVGAVCYVLLCEHWALYAAAEVEAREARRGLWVELEPVAPWEWRRAKRKK